MARRESGVSTAAKEAAITELARTGNPVKAAAAAGLSLFQLRDARKADKRFDEDMKEAKETYIENLEEALVEMGRARGNPLPIFGRLKKERPQDWHDKLQQTTVSVNNVSVTPEEVQSAFLAALANMSDDTKRKLAGQPALTDGRPDQPQER